MCDDAVEAHINSSENVNNNKEGTIKLAQRMKRQRIESEEDTKKNSKVIVIF